MTPTNRQRMAAILVLAACSMGAAQTATGAQTRSVGQVFTHAATTLEHEFVPAAAAMPEEKYGFAPTAGEFKGVRTFSSQVKHTATVNYEFAAAILKEKPPVDINNEEGPAALQSKAEILKYLNDSFAYLDRALATIDEHNLVEPLPSPFGKGTITRLGIATEALSHPWDHYGQMVEYLRLNGIVPPASR